MGDETFVTDHLRGVADIILADLRNIARLPDKLHSGQAGVQVAWALIAKTLPPGWFTYSERTLFLRLRSSLKSCRRVSRILSDSAWGFPYCGPDARSQATGECRRIGFATPPLPCCHCPLCCIGHHGQGIRHKNLQTVLA